MGKAHSEDLRQRVVAEVAAGASRRQAAERFKVGISSAIRWVSLKEETGGVAPRRRGGKSRSRWSRTPIGSCSLPAPNRT